MKTLKEMTQAQGDLTDFLNEMLTLFLADCVELNSQLTHALHKVSNLEKKLGTIHSVDFKAMKDSQSLKKDVMDLQQKRLDDARKFQEEVAVLQQSLDEKTRAENDLQIEINATKKKLGQTLAETHHALDSNTLSTKKMEKELWSVTAEKNRFEEVLDSIQNNFLSGTRAQALVEDMKRSSKNLSAAEAEREQLLRQIEDLEQKLADVNASTMQASAGKAQ